MDVAPDGHRSFVFISVLIMRIREDILKLSIVMILLLSVLGCSVSKRIVKQRITPLLSQYSPSQRNTYPDKRIDSNDENRNDSLLLVATDTVSNGDRIITVDIERITIVSKMRSVAERMGQVTLDFVITLPKELLGRSRSIVITPVMHGTNGAIPLEDLVIRGGRFSRLQERDYWQYETYIERFGSDSAGRMAAFDRFVKFPYPRDARLDSVVEQRSAMTYYYSQNVRVDETAKRIAVTLRGRITGIDETVCALPPSDTVLYTISSMLSFVDATPRYITKIIERAVAVKDRSIIRFPVEDTCVLDTLNDNSMQLAHMVDLMQRIMGQKEFVVDAITLTAAASPDGNFAMNERLAKGRAYALKKYLTGICGRGIDSVLSVKWIAEDWAELRRRIEADSAMIHRCEILDIIDKERNPDNREMIIRRRYPQDYYRLKEMHYPQLRAVEVTYDLHRAGMVKDTVHTTVLDTAYMRGVELLRKRKYAAALEILGAYRDRNTVVACMSLGYDLRAEELLSELPKDATTEYLRAIVCSRLNRKRRGRMHLREALRMDERLEFRTNLDPEIVELLKD